MASQGIWVSARIRCTCAASHKVESYYGALRIRVSQNCLEYGPNPYKDTLVGGKTCLSLLGSQMWYDPGI